MCLLLLYFTLYSIYHLILQNIKLKIYFPLDKLPTFLVFIDYLLITTLLKVIPREDFCADTFYYRI